MKLSEFSQIAEIVSALAVVASLIFVGFEIRQGSVETEINTRAIQVGSYQALMNQLNDISWRSISEPGLTEASTIIKSNPDSATAREIEIYRNWVRILVRAGDMAFYQYQNQIIDQTRLYNLVGILRYELRTSTYFRNMWSTDRLYTSLDAQFRAYMQSMMAEEGIEI